MLEARNNFVIHENDFPQNYFVTPCGNYVIRRKNRILITHYDIQNRLFFVDKIIDKIYSSLWIDNFAYVFDRKDATKKIENINEKHTFKVFLGDIAVLSLIKISQIFLEKPVSFLSDTMSKVVYHPFDNKIFAVENRISYVNPKIWASMFLHQNWIQVYTSCKKATFSFQKTTLCSIGCEVEITKEDFIFDRLYQINDIVAFYNVTIQHKTFPAIIKHPNGKYTGFMVPYSSGVFTVHGTLDDILSENPPHNKILIDHFVSNFQFFDIEKAKVELLNKSFPYPNFRLFVISSKIPYWLGVFYNKLGIFPSEITVIKSRTYKSIEKYTDIANEFGAWAI